MGKLFVAFTLITNLLVCPLRCLPGACGTGSEDSVVRPTCCCCAADNCDESPSKDDLPDHDCPCPNCICEGATLQDGPKIPAVDVHVAVAYWLTPANVASQSRVDVPRTGTMDRSPGWIGGRAAMIDFQVWLI